MDAITFLFEREFARQALVAGLAVASLCSLLSVVVVVKRMAFIGQGISHAGFGGVGTAVFIGLTGLAQDAFVFAFCLATALLIGVLARRKRVEADSAIGIVLVAGMAWGVLANQLRASLIDHDWYVSLFGRQSARPGYEALLFGSLFNVSDAQMWLAVVVAALTILLCAAVFKELCFFTFDESASRVFGMRTGLVHNLLLVVLTIALVLGFRLVGVIMASALLILPGATALQMSRQLGRVLLLAWLTGVLGVIAGLLVSIQLNVPVGPCIVLVLCTCFGGAMLWRSGVSRVAAKAV